MKKTALFLSLCLIFIAAVPAMAGEITIGGEAKYNMYLPDGADVNMYTDLGPWFYNTYKLHLTADITNDVSSLVEITYSNYPEYRIVVPYLSLLSQYYISWHPSSLPVRVSFGRNFCADSRFEVLSSNVLDFYMDGITFKTDELAWGSLALYFNPNTKGYWEQRDLDGDGFPEPRWASSSSDFLRAILVDFRVPFGEVGLNYMPDWEAMNNTYAFSAEAAIPIPVTPVTMVMEVGSTTAQDATIKATLGLHVDIRGTRVLLEGAWQEDGKKVKYGAGISRNFDGLEATLQYQGNTDSTSGSQVSNGRLTGELKVEF